MDAWTTLFDGNGDLRPVSKDALALAGHGGKLYVGGGGGDSDYALSSFDPSTFAWETLPTFEEKGRDRHGMASLEDGNLYVFGGRDRAGTL